MLNGHDIDRARSALQALDPGSDRENWVKAGMAAKAAGLTLGDFITWSETAHNFKSERDTAAAWHSFKDGGITAGTLYHMAGAAGWKAPAGDRQTKQSRKRTNREALSGADAARALWERCEPAGTAHPYLVRKGGKPDGLRVVPVCDSLTVSGQRVAGWLVVPAWSPSEELRTLQLIPPDAGRKLNMPGASFADGYFVVGDCNESARIFIVEGVATAWACWRATGCAAVVCFGAGRMAAVAKALRQLHPVRRLVLCPDRGKEEQAAAVARAVSGEWVEMPAGKAANYDAGDFAAECGDDELEELLSKAKLLEQRYRLISAADVANIPPMRWLVRGVLPGVLLLTEN